VYTCINWHRLIHKVEYSKSEVKLDCLRQFYEIDGAGLITAIMVAG